MVIATGNTLEVDVGEQLLGRILDGMGNPIDDFEPPSLNYSYPVNNQPPNPLSRTKIAEPLPTRSKGNRRIFNLWKRTKDRYICWFRSR